MNTLYDMTVAKELVTYCMNELEGVCKGDLCCGGALYELCGAFFQAMN
jgi:hypothetical protein